MSTLRIRAATNADGPAVRDLRERVLHEFGLLASHDAPDPEGDDLADIERHYLAGGGAFEVVEEAPSGAIVGSAGLFPLEAGTAELRKMYLTPAMRGRGLGRQMLERMLAAARERGFRRVVLETAGALEAAIALYRSAGFQPIDTAGACSRGCEQRFALDLQPAEGSTFEE